MSDVEIPVLDARKLKKKVSFPEKLEDIKKIEREEDIGVILAIIDGLRKGSVLFRVPVNVFHEKEASITIERHEEIEIKGGEFYNMIEGDVRAVGGGTLVIHGMITGNLKVEKEAFVQLNGMLVKNMIVEKNGKAVINGYVRGSVTCKGGEVEISGLVVGDVINEGGKITLAENATVKGKVIQ